MQPPPHVRGSTSKPTLQYCLQRPTGVLANHRCPKNKGGHSTPHVSLTFPPRSISRAVHSIRPASSNLFTLSPHASGCVPPSPSVSELLRLILLPTCKRCRTDPRRAAAHHRKEATARCCFISVLPYIFSSGHAAMDRIQPVSLCVFMRVGATVGGCFVFIDPPLHCVVGPAACLCTFCEHFVGLN